MFDIKRCGWVSADPIYIRYHDEEWGVPEHDDDKLFEKLILDGAQAGLSWITILKKRENYRAAFDYFDAQQIALYTEADVERLMQDAGIIRNRQKITSAITNARAYLALKDEGKTLNNFLWDFVDGRTLQGRRSSLKEIPTSSPESVQMSKALKARGFKFVGPTIIYAFMQATGMVNDHLLDCFRHDEVCRAQ
jgi:DNA-3-methyladenine glycosylase I